MSGRGGYLVFARMDVDPDFRELERELRAEPNDAQLAQRLATACLRNRVWSDQLATFELSVFDESLQVEARRLVDEHWDRTLLEIAPVASVGIPCAVGVESPPLARVVAILELVAVKYRSVGRTVVPHADRATRKACRRIALSLRQAAHNLKSVSDELCAWRTYAPPPKAERVVRILDRLRKLEAPPSTLPAGWERWRRTT